MPNRFRSRLRQAQMICSRTGFGNASRNSVSGFQSPSTGHFGCQTYGLSRLRQAQYFAARCIQQWLQQPSCRAVDSIQQCTLLSISWPCCDRHKPFAAGLHSATPTTPTGANQLQQGYIQQRLQKPSCLAVDSIQQTCACSSRPLWPGP